MKYRFWIKSLLFFIALSLLTAVLGMLFCSSLFTRDKLPPSATTNSAPTRYKTVIIDAGHGGEDGGASSAAGLIEKEVNLEISKLLAEMLRAEGVNVIMTREDDRLLYDRNTNYKGRKKKLDLAARLAIADSTPDAIFVSIHMNSFTDPQYRGLQVWYSQNHPDSAILAELIRKENKEKLQPDNQRQTKAANSSINLLHNASRPAVLVECGFLSNVDEAALFETSEYRQKVALMLFCSITEFLNNTSNT